MARRKRKRGVARHKRAGVRAKRRRASKLKKRKNRTTGDTVVWVSSAGWRDNDTSMSVAGFDKGFVERTINKMMKEEAESAYDSELYDSVDDALDGIAWYGVSSFKLKDLVDSDRALNEAIRDLEEDGHFYPETP